MKGAGDHYIYIRKSGEAVSCEAASSQEMPNSVMLENLSEEIRGCLRHAEECARKAEEASKSRLREEFLEMKRRWLRLAHSYQFAQKLKSFRKARL
jgi:hypothetical protein